MVHFRYALRQSSGRALKAYPDTTSAILPQCLSTESRRSRQKVLSANGPVPFQLLQFFATQALIYKQEFSRNHEFESQLGET
jgi:hypothetical protein